MILIPVFDWQGRVDVATLPTFRKNLLPPSSVLKIKSDCAKWSMMQEGGGGGTDARAVSRWEQPAKGKGGRN